MLLFDKAFADMCPIRSSLPMHRGTERYLCPVGDYQFICPGPFDPLPHSRYVPDYCPIFRYGPCDQKHSSGSLHPGLSPSERTVSWHGCGSVFLRRVHLGDILLGFHQHLRLLTRFPQYIGIRNVFPIFCEHDIQYMQQRIRTGHQRLVVLLTIRLQSVVFPSIHRDPKCIPDFL